MNRAELVETLVEMLTEVPHPPEITSIRTTEADPTVLVVLTDEGYVFFRAQSDEPETKPRMVIKHHWKSQVALLKDQLRKAPEESEGQPSEFQTAYKSGIYRGVAESALKLIDKLIEAGEGGEIRD